MRINNSISPVILAKKSHSTLHIVRLLRFRVPKWARSEAVPENRCQFDVPIPASCRGLVDKRRLVGKDNSMPKGIETVGEREQVDIRVRIHSQLEPLLCILSNRLHYVFK